MLGSMSSSKLFRPLMKIVNGRLKSHDSGGFRRRIRSAAAGNGPIFRKF